MCPIHESGVCVGGGVQLQHRPRGRGLVNPYKGGLLGSARRSLELRDRWLAAQGAGCVPGPRPRRGAGTAGLRPKG